MDRQLNIKNRETGVIQSGEGTMNGSMLLVKHLPDRLHLILSTRADPPLPLSQLRSHKHLLEVRTNQLRCTAEETRDILKVVMGIQVPDETIQQVTTRTEGWLV